MTGSASSVLLSLVVATALFAACSGSTRAARSACRAVPPPQTDRETQTTSKRAVEFVGTYRADLTALEELSVRDSIARAETEYAEKMTGQRDDLPGWVAARNALERDLREWFADERKRGGAQLVLLTDQTWIFVPSPRGLWGDAEIGGGTWRLAGSTIVAEPSWSVALRGTVDEFIDARPAPPFRLRVSAQRLVLEPYQLLLKSPARTLFDRVGRALPIEFVKRPR